MRKLLLTALSVLLVAATAFAQNRQVSGVVSGSDGSPMSGVTVVLDGSTNVGTITDISGRYSLSVPSNGTLTFSFIGMETHREAVSGRAIINVTMADASIQTEEVVVVAYGTTSKEAFTGSVATIDGGDLAKNQASNISNALTGKVAGLQVTSSSGQPGTAGTIRIRGVGSLSASNNPLTIVDGMPYDGSLAAINSADIESISVLKDAAAAAIYGARGANGVVIVTTKKGRSRDAVVTFDSRYGINQRTIPGYNTMDDPAMYYETFYKALYNSQYYNNSGSGAAHRYATANLLNIAEGGLGMQVYTVPEGQRFIGTNFKLNPNATLGYSDPTPNANGERFYYTPDDWEEVLFGTNQIRQEYNVSVSGAGDKGNYYFSGGYLDDNGLVPSSGFTRYTSRVNADYQAKKWLKVGGNMSYTQYNSKSPSGQTDWGSSGNAFYYANMIAPIYPMYVRSAEDGRIMVDERGITRYDFGSSMQQNRAFLSGGNPMIVLDLNTYEAITDVVGGKWYATANLLEGLDLTANLGVNNRNQRQAQLGNPFYGGSTASGGYVQVAHVREFGFDQQYLLTYKKLCGKHNFDALLGYESYDYTTRGMQIYNTQLYSPWVPEINNTIFDKPSVSSSTNKYATKGVFFRGSYDYDGKYFVSASYRRDASSRFAPGHKWGNFGSVSAAWIISKENFFESLDASWLDFLKYKVSYGIQGNDGIGGTNYYPWADQYTVANDGTGNFAVKLAYKGNRDITWETSYGFNTGLEFSLFGGRLDGGIDYFHRKTVDLLFNKPVAVSLGYASVPMNVGSLRNSGVELELNGVLITNQDITWSVNANASTVSNKILELDESIRARGIRGTTSRYIEGSSVYDIFLAEYVGVDPETGKSLYYMADSDGNYLDKDGNITTDKSQRAITDDWNQTYQVNLGSSMAKVFGGFGTTFQWKGLDASLQFSYQVGGKMYDFSYQELMHNGDNAGMNWHKDILRAWTPENRNTDVPRLNSDDVSYQYLSSRFVVSSDYLSINNITLGYTLPQKWTQKLGIGSVRVYGVADNVWVLTKRQGIDPRQIMAMSDYRNSGAFRYSGIRSMSGGVTITF